MYRRTWLVLAVVAVFAFAGSSAEAAKKNKNNDGMVDGKVKAVDASSLTIAGRKDKNGGEKPDIVIKLNKDTKVTMNGTAKEVSDISAGARVSVKLGDDKVTASSVELGAKGKAKEKKKKDK